MLELKDKLSEQQNLRNAQINQVIFVLNKLFEKRDMSKVSTLKCLIGKEEKDLIKIKSIFAKNETPYLPETINSTDSEKITTLVTTILNILTKTIPKPVEKSASKPSHLTKIPKISAQEVLKERNKETEIKKEIRQLETQIEKIDKDYATADRYLMEIDQSLIALRATDVDNENYIRYFAKAYKFMEFNEYLSFLESIKNYIPETWENYNNKYTKITNLMKLIQSEKVNRSEKDTEIIKRQTLLDILQIDRNFLFSFFQKLKNNDFDENNKFDILELETKLFLKQEELKNLP